MNGANGTNGDSSEFANKKGTMHFEFTNDKVWERFNYRVAEIKGWALPRKTDSKSKGTEHVKETGMMVY